MRFARWGFVVIWATLCVIEAVRGYTGYAIAWGCVTALAVVVALLPDRRDKRGVEPKDDRETAELVARADEPYWWDAHRKGCPICQRRDT
ncbi:hypothetical protein [Streptomyces microflavus]|uniref:hypothetical protein n=1 Tax=Streptomyces microflavus TaxID=1919 RepID=UPI0036929730